MSNTHEAQARLDGQMAALSGKQPSDNPHEIGTYLSRAWAKGFDEILPPASKPLISEVQAITCDYYDISHGELIGDLSEYLHARWVSMHVCKEITGKSLRQIGQAFWKRDHSTVLNAHRQIQKMIATNPEIETAVRVISARAIIAANTRTPAQPETTKARAA